MAGWQRLRSRVICTENGIALALLILAALLMVPALRSFVPTTAQTAGAELTQRLKAVETRARIQGRLYTVHFTPRSGKVVVERWTTTQQGVQLQAEEVYPYSAYLRAGTTIETTTLPEYTYTVSDHGFPLTSGRIDLRAPDGSRYSLEVGQ